MKEDEDIIIIIIWLSQLFFSPCLDGKLKCALKAPFFNFYVYIFQWYYHLFSLFGLHWLVIRVPRNVIVVILIPGLSVSKLSFTQRKTEQSSSRTTRIWLYKAASFPRPAVTWHEKKIFFSKIKRLLSWEIWVFFFQGREKEWPGTRTTMSSASGTGRRGTGWRRYRRIRRGMASATMTAPRRWRPRPSTSSTPSRGRGQPQQHPSSPPPPPAASPARSLRRSARNSSSSPSGNNTHRFRSMTGSR